MSIEGRFRNLPARALGLFHPHFKHNGNFLQRFRLRFPVRHAALKLGDAGDIDLIDVIKLNHDRVTHNALLTIRAF